MPDCDAVCKPNAIRAFARSQFETVGITDIAERVARGEPLDSKDSDRLTDIALPLLAELVTLLPDFELCTCPAVDPAVYLPWPEWTKSDGADAAVVNATTTVRDAASRLAKLIEQDEGLREFGNSVHTLHVVIDTFEAPVHEGLKTIIQDMSPEAEDITISILPLTQDLFPANHPDEPQAANTMRLIAISRLTSNQTEIRAPLGRLGLEAAHVALSFGANHLGHVALDAGTAAALHIPPWPNWPTPSDTTPPLTHDFQRSLLYDCRQSRPRTTPQCG